MVKSGQGWVVKFKKWHFLPLSGRPFLPPGGGKHDKISETIYPLEDIKAFLELIACSFDGIIQKLYLIRSIRS